MYHIEVKVKVPGNHDRGPVEEWRKLHPSNNAEPYRFPNEDVASKVAKHIYPDHNDSVRVVPAR